MRPLFMEPPSEQPQRIMEEFKEADKISFTLDASKKGCTGMFWRSKPVMSASVSAADWPHNGTVLQGWKSTEHPGWVKIDHPQGYWMPIQQDGYDVVHFNK